MDVVHEILPLLGGSAALVAALAWLLRSLIDLQVAKDKKAHEIRLNDTTAAARARDDRIRGELLRWTNPILGAVRDLKSRLENILENGAHPALDPQFHGTVKRGWTITFSYFMPSTLYLFCQYFYWVKRLRDELSFEIFRSQADMDSLVGCLDAVSEALSKWPLDAPCEGSDSQVFRLQQRVLGEALIVRSENARCMGYDDFLERWESRPLATHLAPLRSLVEGVTHTENGDCRWLRLRTALQALRKLEAECERILKLPQ